jgi:cysteine protease ATG4
VEDDDDTQEEDFENRDAEEVVVVVQQENGTKHHRMHTARARDGGRTQSGGVKDVLTAEDGGDTLTV